MGQSGGTAQEAGKGQGTASPSASAELVVEFEDAMWLSTNLQSEGGGSQRRRE